MPTRGRGPELLVDTSVAIAMVLADHEHHQPTFEALHPHRLGLCGHAAFETFSVLTRLPAPARRTPAAVAHLLSTNFPHSRYLSAEAAGSLLDRLPADGVAGGAVYDALVAATAAEHRVPLATRDRRALETYRAFDVEVMLLPAR